MKNYDSKIDTQPIIFSGYRVYTSKNKERWIFIIYTEREAPKRRWVWKKIIDRVYWLLREKRRERLRTYIEYLNQNLQTIELKVKPFLLFPREMERSKYKTLVPAASAKGKGAKLITMQMWAKYRWNEIICYSFFYYYLLI